MQQSNESLVDRVNTRTACEYLVMQCVISATTTWEVKMIKRIAAIIAAAGCAALIVSVVPEVAVGNSQNAGTPVASVGGIDRVAEVGIAARVDTPTQHKITCTQGWPYYEKTCLHDGRPSSGKAQMVRMIAIDHLTKSGKLQTRD
jgi:hypothetical protein